MTAKRKEEPKIELVTGSLVEVVAEAISKGCMKPEVVRVCAGQKWCVWCIRDGKFSKRYRNICYLQGELPKDAELLAMDIVVLNYWKRKLWLHADYNGV